jgi:lysophospholipase L1-like esterase
MPLRRTFLKNILAATAIANVSAKAAKAKSLKGTDNTQNGSTVLFQGDSITDGNRTRNNDWNHVMGHGYAYTIASKLWYEHPDRGFHFLNRGISGNQVTDLAKRWQSDTIDLKPDWLSILVGINDTEAFIRGDLQKTAELFETNYRALLKETREQLPNVRLILGEPFILPVGRVKDKLELYQLEIGKRQKIVKRLANEFSAIHIPFQSAFNDALAKAPAEYWIWDGIHPMPAGHELMARLWLEKTGSELGI